MTGGWAFLTARERQVVEAVVEGLSNAEIADELDVSVQTVKFHLTAVLRKLRMANRVSVAVAYVREVERDGTPYGTSRSPARRRVVRGRVELRPREGIPMSAPGRRSA